MAIVHSIVHELMFAMSLHAHRPAILDEQGQWVTYRALLDAIHEEAIRLRADVRYGDRVAVACTHPYREAVTIVALMLLEAVIIPLPIKYGDGRSKQVLQLTRPHWLYEDGRIQLVASAMDFNDTPLLPPSFIMFTSGSTGQPKGAVLTYDNILANIHDIQTYFPLRANDRLFVHRSLSHASVLTGELLYGLLSGASLIFYDEAFVPRRMLAAMQQAEASVLCTTPTVCYKLAQDRADYTLPQLRLVALMGEFLHIQIARYVQERYPHTRFFMNYGQTEASPRLTYLPDTLFTKKEGCIGIALPSVETRIVSEQGMDVTDGEIGELLVRGPNVFLGYWEQPELTAQRVKNGWLHTGDMVYRGADSYLYIAGRKDDMIVRAGMNIYPKEIEDILLDDRRIREVVAYGEFDPKYGQKLCVDVVPYTEAILTPSDIIAMCRKELAAYQYPDRIQIVEELPRNQAGKLMRRKV